MDDVAHELGISKKTLYTCVKDKTDLVKLTMSQADQVNKDEIASIASKNLPAVDELFEFNAYMRQMIREQNPSMNYDLQKYYPEIFKELQESRYKSMHEAIRQNLVKGIAEGFYRKEIDVDVISHLQMTFIEYRYNYNNYKPDSSDSEAVIREIMIYHLHGIATTQGLRVLEKKLKTNPS